MASRQPVRLGSGRLGVAALAACGLVAIGWVTLSGDDDVRPRDEIVIVPGGLAPATSVPVAPAGGAAPAIGDSPGRRFAQSLQLTPQQIEGRQAGYVIAAASDADWLSRTKLRTGDMLVDLDGRALDPVRVAQLGDELAAADAVEVTFLRGGQLRKRQISLVE